jgi:cytochrome c nitrite reductase small subunit
MVAAVLGVAIGLGAFTFVYAKGGSYLTDSPAACANCHVMSDQYAGWHKSSHRKVAVCNDCHTPHDFFGKYFTKALNGYHHSSAFTTGNFHEPIQISPRNRAITEAACRSCHAPITQAIDPHPTTGELSCITCHRGVGHRNEL